MRNGDEGLYALVREGVGDTKPHEMRCTSSYYIAQSEAGVLLTSQYTVLEVFLYCAK